MFSIYATNPSAGHIGHIKLGLVYQRGKLDYLRLQTYVYMSLRCCSVLHFTRNCDSYWADIACSSCCVEVAMRS